MKFGILDYGVIDEGQTAADALGATLKLAKRADELGFNRFWVAEHHNLSAFAISAPEIIMAHLASQTKQIRIGSGGIMGLHYSPYKVAEIARTLATLYPGRIDIGLGNSLGTALVHQHMKSLYTNRDYGTWLETLLHYLEDKKEEIVATPQLTSSLELFVLGTGGRSVHEAARLGLGFSYGSFPFIAQNPLETARLLGKIYREQCTAFAQNKEKLLLALFVVIAETMDMAESFAKPLDIWMLGKEDFNEFSCYPSIKTAQAYTLTEAERAQIAANRTRILVGDVKAVEQSVNELVRVSGADEVIFIPLIPDIAHRMRALELLIQIQMNDK
ncbi:MULTISPECIES: MsnO8 family LLM class oxidoreductase [unclassified Streptococcus]|uniref:MsnO8 family LLM class oxidoreductase n=1 Tax=unclassified Streptococcus TaxID=2608887 RepID=UPI001071BB4A|nr:MULTISPECIES: MsnO8 family LLM class oxidoreductase [unclassified Streptococcus]MBF0787353.1 MsnO8 family LLM class oxidoreductase [Streptococcus sp. 19428wC2_LYSM12]MCQ9211109.1 MsnO8 family LLM class oxidoreductase [Streptococcus sp. B01]MCQ9214384.1 MsnO8 family LLM class oxidoreductase [Streptococcus sp. O1]TFV05699.1 MsnO8 family LLM class oxidoreductase [Streptococcus sp. LYSM12]